MKIWKRIVCISVVMLMSEYFASMFNLKIKALFNEIDKDNTVMAKFPSCPYNVRIANNIIALNIMTHIIFEIIKVWLPVTSLRSNLILKIPESKPERITYHVKFAIVSIV